MRASFLSSMFSTLDEEGDDVESRMAHALEREFQDQNPGETSYGELYLVSYSSRER